MNILNKNIFRKEKFNLWFIFLVTALVMLPVLFKGIPYGHDLPHHFQCAFSYYEGIINGDFYPSWSNFRNFGYGGMELRLYPPISHYTLALFYLLTQNWHIATWLALTFFTVLGSFGIYLWARELMSPSQAVFAACIYAFLPYHLTQIYNTFFYAEFAGSAILPFCFAFIARLGKRGKPIDVCGLGISYAVLILTHLPLTVIGSICLGIYALSFFDQKDLLPKVLKLTSALIIGLTGSSFFWIKVIQERSLLAKTSVYPDQWLDYRLNFLLTPLQTYSGFGLEVYNNGTFFYDLMFLCAVVLALSCTLPFIILSKDRIKGLAGVWIVFAFSVFLVTPFSRFLWDNLPFLQEVQFPWRWLTIISITAAILSASRLDRLFEWFRSSKRPIALIICGCIFAVITFSISQIINQSPFVAKNDVPNWVKEVQNSSGVTFWWSIWTKKEFADNKEKITAGNRPVQIQKWNAVEKDFQISAGEATSGDISVFYHPNWKAKINGVLVETKPGETGNLLVSIPKEDSSIKLYFEETMEVTIAQWISLTAWICLFLAVLRLRKNGFSLPNQKIQDNFTENKNPLNFRSLLKIAETKYRWILLVIFGIISLLPILLIGFYSGNDLSQHTQFAVTFQNSINSGVLYPSWAADENFGYGGLGVRSYPPLTPFLIALTKIISGDWFIANFTVFLFFTLIGGLGIYLWAKEFLSPSTSIWAGVIFIFMPYHLFEINNASQFAEFAGCSVITFCFFFAARVCRRGLLIDILGLAISYAVLVLTHLPTTVIGSIAIFVYALFQIPKTKFGTTILKLGLSIGFGLLASSAYWARMITEKGWLRNTSLWKGKDFDYNFHFLIPSPWGETNTNFVFIVILVSLTLLVLGSVISLHYSNNTAEKRNLSGVIILFFFSVFMTTALSQPVWNLVPYLKDVQFPSRWLTIVSVSGAMIIISGIKSMRILYQSSKQAKNLIQIFTVIIFLCFSFILSIIAAEFQTNYISRSNFDGWVSENSHKIGGEWFWTIKTKEEIFDIKEKVKIENRETNILDWQPTERTFVVKSGKPSQLRVATFYYPYWKATINNAPTEISLADDGAMLISLPSEESYVNLYFQEPLWIQTANITSVIMWIILVITLLYQLQKSYLTSKKD